MPLSWQVPGGICVNWLRILSSHRFNFQLFMKLSWPVAFSWVSLQAFNDLTYKYTFFPFKCEIA